MSESGTFAVRIGGYAGLVDVAERPRTCARGSELLSATPRSGTRVLSRRETRPTGQGVLGRRFPGHCLLGGISSRRRPACRPGVRAERRGATVMTRRHHSGLGRPSSRGQADRKGAMPPALAGRDVLWKTMVDLLRARSRSDWPRSIRGGYRPGPQALFARRLDVTFGRAAIPSAVTVPRDVPPSRPARATSRTELAIGPSALLATDNRPTFRSG